MPCHSKWGHKVFRYPGGSKERATIAYATIDEMYKGLAHLVGVQGLLKLASGQGTLGPARATHLLLTARRSPGLSEYAQKRLVQGFRSRG
eukprot:376136-Heterocapsa_arctica.AAC.1